MNGMDIILYEYVFAKRNQFKMWSPYEFSNCGGDSWSPPYLSQPFVVRFSKFLCLVKACENRHWFLFHNWLPTIHRLAARGRQSGEGQSRQYFKAKNPKISIFSYKYVIYLKWKLKLCRIQIHVEKTWFDGKNFFKNPIFIIFASKRGWPDVFDG